jgi:hypothetical protein
VQTVETERATSTRSEKGKRLMTAKKRAKQPKQPKSKKDLNEQDLSSVAGGAAPTGVPRVSMIVAMPHVPRAVEIVAMPSSGRPAGVAPKGPAVMTIVAMKRP